MKSLQSELEGQKKRRVFETRPFRLDAPIRLARARTDEEEKEGDDESNLSCVLRLASRHLPTCRRRRRSLQPDIRQETSFSALVLDDVRKPQELSWFVGELLYKKWWIRIRDPIRSDVEFALLHLD
jgi:hypothetical protein